MPLVQFPSTRERCPRAARQPRWRAAGRSCAGACLVALALAACGDPAPPLAAAPAPQDLPEADIGRGKALVVRYACASCHEIPGVRGASARVGPTLRNLGERAYLGGVLANTPANLVSWLRDPPAHAPGTAMPDVGLTADQARDIAAYLLTLR
ncbi:c-type cytochrome [Bordetella genomosp. 7]|uniref:Cytochrome c domain-containing protein n=1 Tax=Bordetella genomosp. 7 TaxID=1416805 RepID=A0A261QYA0_9BORD|nr:c-type cytochrome [Bordetella genomosp. 7]OZI17716.1 hypothetical protein CAL19_11400 [Bordetella genomosp. 7]